MVEDMPLAVVSAAQQRLGRCRRITPNVRTIPKSSTKRTIDPINSKKLATAGNATFAMPAESSIEAPFAPECESMLTSPSRNELYAIVEEAACLLGVDAAGGRRSWSFCPGGALL